MKKHFLLSTLVATILLVSCSSSKRMAQTVDDLYFSPTPEYVKQKEEEKNERELEEQREENFLRNKVRNRNRWQRIDDFSYWNDTRFTFNHCGCNNTFTNWNTYYNGWVNPYTNLWVGGCGNSWNNPFFTFVPYVAPTIKPANNWANIKSYNNNNYNNTNFTFNPKTGYSNSNNNTATINTNTSRPNSNGGFFNNAIRVFTGGSAPSSNAGGKSGGFNSSGSSSSSTPRAGRTKN